MFTAQGEADTILLLHVWSFFWSMRNKLGQLWGFLFVCFYSFSSPLVTYCKFGNGVQSWKTSSPFISSRTGVFLCIPNSLVHLNFLISQIQTSLNVLSEISRYIKIGYSVRNSSEFFQTTSNLFFFFKVWKPLQITESLNSAYNFTCLCNLLHIFLYFEFFYH